MTTGGIDVESMIKSKASVWTLPFACNGRRRRSRTVSLFAELKRRSR